MRLTLAAALLASTFATAAPALDLTAMSDAERSAFGAAVRSYLMENPQVLMEAIAELEKQQQNDQLQADLDMLRVNADAIFNDPASWAGGNLKGDITVVEFVDYRCGYCRKAHDEVSELVGSDGNIRLVMKEFPILGDDSVTSSRFAISVLQKAGPEAYKRAHDLLITHKGPVDDATLGKFATDLGLSPDTILGHMTSDAVNTVINDNHALGQRLQINGTPTFVIHETMVRGYVPLDGMQSIVAGQRRKN
jgi:protein-disulfide isomerase